MSQSSRPDLERFIERLTSRSVLTDEERRAILGLPCHAQLVRANHDFVGLGEVVDHTSLVVDGLIGRFDQNALGLRQITAIHIPGDMANLHSVVQPQATSALQALSVATILRIPNAAIRRATAKHPALAEALWRDCMVDTAVLAQWVVNVGRRDARSRIAHLLCELATRLGVLIEPGPCSFPFFVTQAQLADATGLTVVHVNRVLKSLRIAGLADVRRNLAVVHDPAGLAAVGDFDRDYLQTEIKPEERLRIVPPTLAPA